MGLTPSEITQNKKKELLNNYRNRLNYLYGKCEYYVYNTSKKNIPLLWASVLNCMFYLRS